MPTTFTLAQVISIMAGAFALTGVGGVLGSVITIYRLQATFMQRSECGQNRQQCLDLRSKRFDSMEATMEKKFDAMGQKIDNFTSAIQQQIIVLIKESKAHAE